MRWCASGALSIALPARQRRQYLFEGCVQTSLCLYHLLTQTLLIFITTSKLSRSLLFHALIIFIIPIKRLLKFIDKYLIEIWWTAMVRQTHIQHTLTVKSAFISSEIVWWNSVYQRIQKQNACVLLTYF